MTTPIDDNGAPLLYGVSHLDGITPVAIKFTGRRMGTDSVTAIAFNPSVVTMTPYLAKATSSTDNVTRLPIVVNASTGKVLISP